jgi:hypothetical protein
MEDQGTVETAEIYNEFPGPEKQHKKAILNIKT